MTQMKSRKLVTGIILLLAIVLIVLSIPRARAQAQDASGTVESPFPEPREADSSEWKPHLGVRGGYVNPDDNFNGSVEYGVEAGFQPYIPVGLGLEFTHFRSDSDTAGRPDLERTNLLARGTYNFGGNVPIIRTSYLGAGLGPVFDHDNNDDRTRFGFNLLAGFDIPLDGEMGLGPNSFSLGAVANYLFVSDNGADTFGLNGAVKYWF
jgi:hypothetical protein